MDNASDITGMIEELNLHGRRRTPFLFFVDFELKHLHCIPLGEVRSDTILYFINGLTNAPACGLCTNVTIVKHPVPYEEYLKAFDRVMEELGKGNTYLLNLTFPTRVETSVPLRDLFFLSNARYKLWLRDAFVVFSPETFIKVNGRTISSFPMKGTIDASVENAEERILKDDKEHAEHVTIVDLIRNDLSMVAKDVTVRRFRYVERIRTNQKDLLQVSSEITGELDAHYNEILGDILFAMLPAGSVTGAPKKKTVELIKGIERSSRGYYTGVFGWFDGHDLDSAVMIRFIEDDGGEYTFKSGGGITVYSDPRKEYRELIDKIYVPVI
ncbi:MAG: aminodeoxychorismate synthase component I [Deltaproteobacteria bacterium]|nr:aminodeoxychorismate synthase component I [Deltaproteobacteria bacterium]MCL5277641.1 aminodeoxychorismate synthase component I [Deltaproteobacteria bacterium]